MKDEVKITMKACFHPSSLILKELERETGFEPATSTLARSHSTTELLPHFQRGSILTIQLALSRQGYRTTNRFSGGLSPVGRAAGLNGWKAEQRFRGDTTRPVTEGIRDAQLDAPFIRSRLALFMHRGSLGTGDSPDYDKAGEGRQSFRSSLFRQLNRRQRAHSRSRFP
jgi:hypothetical protein